MKTLREQYQEAVNVINSTKELKVNELSMTISAPIGFVYETYTEEVKQAIDLLQIEYGFCLQ